MTVNHRTAQLGTNLIELIAEVGHLIGAVLVAGNDLVDRVNDDRCVVLLFCSADQLRSKLVHYGGKLFWGE